jgi:hypothetical protein
VHHVGAARKRAAQPPVRHEVRNAIASDLQRDHLAGFAVERLEIDLPQIAAEAGRRDRRDAPAAASRERHLVRETAVLGHHVRVGDRHEVSLSGHRHAPASFGSSCTSLRGAFPARPDRLSAARPR